MLDPFPPPPAFLAVLSAPLASRFGLPTLPLHVHEVLLAFAFYQLVNTVGSPWLSRRLFPTIYPGLNARTKLNWDVHVVSLVQSCLISGLALWVMAVDAERGQMDGRQRIWGYTGAGGMIQGLAAGYFLWDLCVSTLHVGIFGWGLLAHAVAALLVFSLGFRPFVNFYGPTFILYELSSPFLNFHWFFDKVHMTGSRAQLYNGIVLLVAFFCCRLVWGTYQSVRIYQDVWAAIQRPGTVVTTANSAPVQVEPSWDKNAEIMRFAAEETVPVWLAVTYLGSNIVLNSLNFYWFGKMIEAVTKRFQPAKEKVGVAINRTISPASAGVETEKDGKTLVAAEQVEVRRRKV